MNTIIAIPSEQPGGMDANVGAHFGHCEIYTVVSVAEGKIENIQILPNIPHEQGGCMAPVNYLAQHGVKTMVAGGMGLRPLMGFNQVGIDVYFSGGVSTVREAVDAVLDGKLVKFTQAQTCGGGAAHAHNGNCGNHQH